MDEHIPEKKERRKESSLRLLRLNYIAAKILQKNEALLLKTCVEPKRKRQKSKVNLPNGTKSLWDDAISNFHKIGIFFYINDI